MPPSRFGHLLDPRSAHLGDHSWHCPRPPGADQPRRRAVLPPNPTQTYSASEAVIARWLLRTTWGDRLARGGLEGCPGA